jgi:PPOX class probable F420-dependent enzyme
VRHDRTMARRIASNTVVDRDGLLAFVRPRHAMVLITHKRDGGLQTSPVTGGLDDAGRVVISTYPRRAKVVNLRHDPAATVLVLSDGFGDAWVQLTGTAEIIDIPDSVEPLVDYFRAISGEHPDWDEYRQAMITQQKSIIRIAIQSWGPIATGGFPANLADS